MTIAQTILDQLGGRRFCLMTGAKNLLNTGNGLAMRLPFPKVNYVKVTLNENDLYDVEYGRIRGAKYTLIEKDEGIYADMLQTRFKAVTGLDTKF